MEFLRGRVENTGILYGHEFLKEFLRSPSNFKLNSLGLTHLNDDFLRGEDIFKGFF